MSIHRKRGRFRAVITAAALAAGALAAVSAPNQPAAASGACTPSSSAIPDWAEAAAPAGGVTLCVGTHSVLGVAQTDAYVQIVDLSAGAKVRLIADPSTSTDPIKYNVRTAADWDSWIRSHVTSPDSSRLFSTSNAAFFVDDSGPPSALSLPFVQTSNTSFFSDPGFALISHEQTPGNEDPAWDQDKRAITFGDQNATPQEVHMFDFPMHYTRADLGTPLAPLCSSTCPEWDATVGLTSDFGGSTGSKRRVYVGVSAPPGSFNYTKVYLLDTMSSYTALEAKGILESFGSQLETQLDGGGSTQLYANGNHLIDSNVPFTGRTVPMALAVYKAAPPPPPPPTRPMEPGADPVAVVYGNSLQVFARSLKDSSLISAWCGDCNGSGSDWHPGNLGGRISGRPSIVTYNGQIHVFAEGKDENGAANRMIYHKWYASGAGWSGWTQVGSCCATAPVATVYNDSLQLFARDTGTKHLISAWCHFCDNTDWHFGDLGGGISGTPSVVTYNGQIHVFAEGINSAGLPNTTIYHKWYDNGWHDWQQVGSCCATAPVTTVYNNALQLFARDTGTKHLDSAWCQTCDANNNNWHFGDLGGVISGRPDVSVYGDQLRVLANGDSSQSSTGNTVFQRWFHNSSGWHPWEALIGNAHEPAGYEYGGNFHVLTQTVDLGHVFHAWCSSPCTFNTDINFEDLSVSH
jgi:hypothetical protein